MSNNSSAVADPITLIVAAVKAAWNEMIEVVGTLLGVFGFLAMLNFGLHGL